MAARHRKTRKVITPRQRRLLGVGALAAPISTSLIFGATTGAHAAESPAQRHAPTQGTPQQGGTLARLPAQRLQELAQWSQALADAMAQAPPGERERLASTPPEEWRAWAQLPPEKKQALAQLSPAERKLLAELKQASPQPKQSAQPPQQAQSQQRTQNSQAPQPQEPPQPPTAQPPAQRAPQPPQPASPAPPPAQQARPPADPNSHVTAATHVGKGSDAFFARNVGRRISDPREAFFVPFKGNPVITGQNLYAPSPVKANGKWNVYFGGWLGQTTYDAIYMATTTDDTLTSGLSPTREVIGHGVYQHVNDPSVVKRDDGWFMAMTTKPMDTVDQCSIVVSSDGVNWPQLSDRSHEVSFTGASVASCARPTLNWNANYGNGAGRWEMYFDGSVNGGPHGQHLAVSTEAVPKNFTYVAPVGPFVDADIRLVNGQYIAAYRRIGGPNDWRINYATSKDGVHFAEHGELLAPDPLAAYDDCGVTNPGWAVNEQGHITALMYGGTDSCSYNTHKLGVALPQSAVTLHTGGTGHGHRQAVSATEQRIDTHEMPTVDRIQVTDRPGTAPRIDQPVSGSRGDIWSVG